MQILDETFGPMNWETDYKEIKGNLFCGIGVDNGERVVWKWDCGIESREDGEGNEKKGEASDAFKRAGFKWGIGRELYTAPFIFIKAETTEKNGKYYLKNKFAKYEVGDIDYDDKRNISYLEIVDENGTTVFKFGGANKPKIATTSQENKKVDEVDLPFNTLPPIPPLTLEEAYQIVVKTREGEKKLKELSKEQLKLIIKHSTVKEWVEGAELILKVEEGRG